MKLISVINQKGGVGKTTLTINLARAIQLDGAKIAVIDCDPQGTTKDWSIINECYNFFPVYSFHLKDLPYKLKEFKNYDFVIIDSAPRLEELAVAIIKVSDFILIPVTPSPSDVWATVSFIDLIKARQIKKPDLKAAFVVNRQKPRTSAIKEVREALNELKFPVLAAGINDRTIYAKCLGQGITIFEADKKSANEFKELSDELSKIFLSKD